MELFKTYSFRFVNYCYTAILFGIMLVVPQDGLLTTKISEGLHRHVVRGWFVDRSRVTFALLNFVSPRCESLFDKGGKLLFQP